MLIPEDDPRDPVAVVAGNKNKRRTLTLDVGNSASAKKPKKEVVHRGKISEVRVVERSNKLEENHLKSLKLMEFEKSLEPVDLSPLVRKFEEVADGEKIPCVNEQSSMFKFMYLLKKNEANLKYFYKYTIIDCGGRLVAIKPFNVSQVTREYLNDARLSAIKRILEQIVVR